MTAPGRVPVLAVTLGLALGGAATARANIQIDITAESNAGATVALRLTVGNSGTEPAHDVTPSVTALGEQQSGQLLPMLDSGANHTWELTLPAPREPGDFPMVIRVRYADPNGLPLSALLVHVDHTPATPRPSVRVTLPLMRVAGQGTAALTIDNPTAQALGGRVVVVVPEEFTPDPESQAATVPAAGRSSVPFGVENIRGPVDSRYPAYAWFDYRQDGVRAIALATTTIDTLPRPASRVPIVLVAVLAAAAGALLAIALRRSRGLRRRSADGPSIDR